MRRLAVFLAVAGMIFGACAVVTAETVVVESVSGSSGDWTYTYTITNQESLDIWNWAVWFPNNPNADSVTAATASWAATNLGTQGFFPEEYNAAWGTTVLDSASMALVGPNAEPGFYQTYASDFTSGNPGEYWDASSSSWVALPVPLPAWPDPIWDAEWRGEDYGWAGSGADMQTSYGIAPGGTGQFEVHSSAADAVFGTKSFSYSTIDYWYSRYDGTSDYMDFEGSGSVIPEPSSAVAIIGLLGTGGALWWRRRRRGATRAPWSDESRQAIRQIIDHGRTGA